MSPTVILAVAFQLLDDTDVQAHLIDFVHLIDCCAAYLPNQRLRRTRGGEKVLEALKSGS